MTDKRWHTGTITLPKFPEYSYIFNEFYPLEITINKKPADTEKVYGFFSLVCLKIFVVGKKMLQVQGI